MDSTMPASKNGIGRIKGPTPKSKLTEVNKALNFGCIQIMFNIININKQLNLLQKLNINIKSVR